MDDVEILAEVSLFSLMKRRDLKRLAKSVTRHHYDKGDIIIREGARDGRLFIMVSGEAEVIKGLGHEMEKSLRMLRAGSYFGEMALIDDYVRTASVVAREKTQVLCLDQWNIREEIKKYPNIAIELMQSLGRRIREYEKSDMC
ncbi:MAG: cyclic nucleotide-binding domain-containing protein [Deltaproteobacteria bacterium]|nr:cyclic nucleotide-binding domain-containing protein [Deltaproteobacteria bacterium]